jgi:hypothetical protein
MINEDISNLLWKRYNEQPSAHLYALWITYKECSDLIGLCLYRGSEKIADIGNDLFWQTYYEAEKRYRYYNEKILEIINKKKHDI